ncbi:MAG: ABC transporter substrate-binding protein [Peptococcaceae bacterium]|jgi:ABC-type nitrate/sulfonate/bicarbonate transport system substrate-binding protein|nr:ABC transporter substrate-binding protein [Peptococcaceae bacterium]
MRTVNVVLDWFANTNHTGFYVALEKGYFRSEGLEPRFHGEVHGEMAAAGADIVMSPQPSLLLGMAAGDRLTTVATLTQKCDSGILSLREAGITRPAELTGKRLTHWRQDWFHRIVGKAVNDDGGDYSQVRLVQKDVGDIEATLGVEADATWIYKNWEYFVMRQAGKEVNYFAFADFGELYNFCAPGVAASHGLIDTEPQVLRAFLGAAERGFIEAAADPDGSAALLERHMPGWDAALIRASQRYASGLYLDAAGHWGRIRPERWNTLADWMVAEKLLAARPSREFTNEFLSR